MNDGHGPRTARRLAACALFVVSAVVVAGCRGPENGQNSLKPDGPSAQKIDNLFVPVYVVSVVIGVLVLAAVLWVALRYRQRGDQATNPKQTHGSTPLEIGWTIAPAIILLVVGFFTVRTIFELAREPKGDVLQVTSVAKQWWWEFRYPDDEIVTANELVIPTDRKVRVNLTACDDTIPNECNVIHSFWAPQLGGKQDVVPGRPQATTIEADEPGTYLGQCAEYCGISHANMRFRVIAVEPGDFDRWIEEQQERPAVPLDAETPEGESQPAGEAQSLVTEKYQCVNCHVFDDSGRPQYGPNLTHLASRSTFASGYYELTRERLVQWLLDAPSLVPMESEDCRKPGAPGDLTLTCVGMPSFTENTPEGQPVMTREDAEQIADYLLSLT